MSFIAWKEINWPLVDSRIFRYQIRIFKAARDNNIPKVRCLQKRLLKSFDAKLVAVKQATTLNDKKTPEANKQVFITNLQKGKVVKILRLDGKALPIRHVYIDKSSKLEKQVLVIRMIEDRAKQALCKLVLEPEWEARFEPNSYGFRPERSCHDAVEAVLLSLRNNVGNKSYHKYILSAKITNKGIHQIDHDYLVTKLRTLPEIEMQIKAWLKVDILEEFFYKEKEINIFGNINRTIPVGVISPFLTNIALHGIENDINKWIYNKSSFVKTNIYNKYAKRKSIALIRYGDAFVLIHKEKNILEKVKQELSKWLWDGPRFKFIDKKTFIRNSNEGFNFLGFSFITIKQDNVPKIKTYPSKMSQEFLLKKISNILQNNRNVSTYHLIKLLRPNIIGWANYFKYSECLHVFNKLTHLVFQKLRAWVFRRDTRNGNEVIKKRYFPIGKSYTFEGIKHRHNWILNGKQLDKNDIFVNNWLPHMIWVKSERWIKIKGTKSPFDDDKLYWEKRMQNKGSSNGSLLQRKLLKLQNGFCPWCKTRFLIGSITEIDHIVPSDIVGKDVYINLQLLHKYCHIEKTKIDGSRKQAKSNLEQEPDEVKISRPDLSTGAKVTRPLV